MSESSSKNNKMADVKQKVPSKTLRAIKSGWSAHGTALRPIVLACMLTAILMSLTIITYVGDAYTSEDQSAAPSPLPAEQAAVNPLTQSDIDQAVEYTKNRLTELQAIETPPAADLSEVTLGL